MHSLTIVLSCSENLFIRPKSTTNFSNKYGIDNHTYGITETAETNLPKSRQGLAPSNDTITSVNVMTMPQEPGQEGAESFYDVVTAERCADNDEYIRDRTVKTSADNDTYQESNSNVASLSVPVGAEPEQSEAVYYNFDNAHHNMYSNIS